MVFRALALLLPVILVLGWIWIGNRHTAPCRADPRIQPLLVRLEQGGGRLWVLGDSRAEENVDRPVLQEVLGESPLVEGVDGSFGAVWYVLLAEHVFERGSHPPRAVLIVGSVEGLLRARPRDARDEALLERFQDPLAPRELVARKAYGQGGFRVAVGRARATTTHLLAQRRELLQAAVVGALFPLAGESSPLRAGTHRLHRARQGAMGMGGVAAGKDDGPRPVLYRLYDRWTRARTARPRIGASFVPELLAGCRKRGVPLVFVRSPEGPGAEEDTAEEAAMSGALQEAFAQEGALFLDLYGMDLPEGSFVDRVHMSPRGARIFTAAIVDALEAWDGFASAPPDRSPSPRAGERP